MDEIKKLFLEIKEDIGTIKKEIKSNNDEIKLLKDEIKLMKEERQQEKEDMEQKLEQAENKIERLEKSRIRNNLVITGIEIAESVKGVIQNFIEDNMNVRANIKQAYKIGEKKYKMEMTEWEDKKTVLKEKRKLKGNDIYIDSEMTLKEQQVQKILRDIARREKDEEKKVKVSYQKMEINGKVFNWNHKQQKLIEDERSNIPKN